MGANGAQFLSQVTVAGLDPALAQLFDDRADMVLFARDSGADHVDVGCYILALDHAVPQSLKPEPGARQCLDHAVVQIGSDL
jgi:hypothetical protein